MQMCWDDDVDPAATDPRPAEPFNLVNRCYRPRVGIAKEGQRAAAAACPADSEQVHATVLRAALGDSYLGLVAAAGAASGAHGLSKTLFQDGAQRASVAKYVLPAPVARGLLAKVFANKSVVERVEGLGDEQARRRMRKGEDDGLAQFPEAFVADTAAAAVDRRTQLEKYKQEKTDVVAHTLKAERHEGRLVTRADFERLGRATVVSLEEALQTLFYLEDDACPDAAPQAVGTDGTVRAESEDEFSHCTAQRHVRHALLQEYDVRKIVGLHQNSENIDFKVPVYNDSILSEGATVKFEIDPHRFDNNAVILAVNHPQYTILTKITKKDGTKGSKVMHRTRVPGRPQTSLRPKPESMDSAGQWKKLKPHNFVPNNVEVEIVSESPKFENESGITWYEVKYDE